MKTTLCALLLITSTVASSSLRSQTRDGDTQRSRVDGIWRVETSAQWVAALRVDTAGVIGVVSSCASQPGEIEIFDGRVEANTVRFKCRSLDGRRTVAFTGKIANDEIQFKWERSGPGNVPEVLFADGASPEFVARRVVDRPTSMEARLAEAANRLRGAHSVGFEAVVRADQTPNNWLTYSGNTFSHRHSRLTQITPTNVSRLQLQWVHQAMTNQPSNTKFEATPLVVDGVMYTVLPPNTATAIDAATGVSLWRAEYEPAATSRVCCGRVNRGVAILGNTLFMGTIDGRLIALEAHTGRRLWDVPVGRPEAGYSITQAPLVVKNLVIVGPAGGEFGIRGFLAAFDAQTGKEVWRFNTVPGPGEFGHDTWGGDSWKTGGAPIWMTGSYDPESNLTYWGTGNPSPGWNGDQRPGDNLFSNSVVALDADTGKLKWHFQFTPHDEFDYDAAQVPVLVDMPWQGKPRKVMLWPNRNGFFYVLDRITGEFLMGKPFVDVNWAKGLDSKGRPIVVPEMLPQPGGGGAMAPGNPGATNWWPPSFSPVTGLLYVPAFAGRTSRFAKTPVTYVEGERFGGGGPQPPALGETPGYGAILALDSATGAKRWEFETGRPPQSGVLTTASNVLFAGDREGSFHALDARTGTSLWRFRIGGTETTGPMTYAVNGRQYVAVASGSSTFAFALPE